MCQYLEGHDEATFFQETVPKTPIQFGSPNPTVTRQCVMCLVEALSQRDLTTDSQRPVSFLRARNVTCSVGSSLTSFYFRGWSTRNEVSSKRVDLLPQISISTRIGFFGINKSCNPFQSFSNNDRRVLHSP